MARFFINMYLDTSDQSGYWIVEYLDHDNTLRKDRFDYDLDANEFYLELMSERVITK
jgi:hypothetical protein